MYLSLCFPLFFLLGTVYLFYVHIMILLFPYFIFSVNSSFISNIVLKNKNLWELKMFDCKDWDKNCNVLKSTIEKTQAFWACGLSCEGSFSTLHADVTFCFHVACFHYMLTFFLHAMAFVELWRPLELSSFSKSLFVFAEVLTDYMFLCCWLELMMLPFQTLALRKYVASAWWMFSNNATNWLCLQMREHVWLSLCIRLQGLDKERVM